jgi:DMSO/TMAO reductase YedYZ molybdopterin-dependent catalytic subunit
MSNRRRGNERATLEPSGPFARHPLRPHQLVDRVTRTEETIILCHLGIPRISSNDWMLTIDGLVRRPLQLTLGDLAKRARVEITSVHQCCGSPLQPELPMRRVSNVVWGGVPLAELIAECEPDPSARFVWSSGADYGTFEGVDCDAYIKDVPIDRIEADVLVAYEMNGTPLRPENGYPARLVVPGYHGTNSVKWLRRLTLAEDRATGPFTTRWYNDAIRFASGQSTGETKPVWSIAPESVIVSPAPESDVSLGGAVEVWGWAWADGSVHSVDVAVNGNWVRATIEASEGYAWRRFTATWQPDWRGKHELSVRARGRDGCCQPPAGARNAIHCVPINVV